MAEKNVVKKLNSVVTPVNQNRYPTVRKEDLANVELNIVGWRGPYVGHHKIYGDSEFDVVDLQVVDSGEFVSIMVGHQSENGTRGQLYNLFKSEKNLVVGPVFLTKIDLVDREGEKTGNTCWTFEDVEETSVENLP